MTFTFQTGSQIIEQEVSFQHSVIWQWQRDYYQSKGVDAWLGKEVPYYATTNVRLAKNYAQLIRAYLFDVAQTDNSDPVYLIECGGGLGKLCFHILEELYRLELAHGTKCPDFCYVLTDIVEDSVDYWRKHPLLAKYIDKGWLQSGTFDIEGEDFSITLQQGSDCHARQDLNILELKQPPLIIANYLLDTLPHELIYVKDQQAYKTLLSLAIPPKDGHNAPGDTNSEETAAEHPIPTFLDLHYEHRPIDKQDEYPAIIEDLISDYSRQLHEAHVPLPTTLLYKLMQLRQQLPHGFAFLVADKGFHHLEEWEGHQAPLPIQHGSFSFHVNFHALTHICRALGGQVFEPDSMAFRLNISLLLFSKQDQPTSRIRETYQNQIKYSGPDDLAALESLLIKHLDTLELHEIVAWLRNAQFDSFIFNHTLPRLEQLAIEGHTVMQRVLPSLGEELLAHHFPLHADDDIAFDLARLFYQLADYQQAIDYFEKSLRKNGPTTGKLYNLAVCHGAQDDFDIAIRYLDELLEHDPGYQLAIELRKSYSSNRAELDQNAESED